jgi:tetratricopeptide (TPR) repeat protein
MGGKRMRIVSAALAVLAVFAVAAPAVAADCSFTKVIDLPITMRGRTPLVPAKVNGHDALFIVDSGAFFSTMGPSAAVKYGMPIEPAPIGLGYVRGIGGEAQTIHSTAANDFIFGNIDFHKVEFLVNERDFGGGAAGLLGQNFLHFADVEYDLGNGAVRLFIAKNCDQSSLAYWAGTQPYSVINIDPTTPATPHTKASAMLNGHRIRVEFDTGAPVSILTLRAAGRAGVHPGDPGVTAGGVMSGVAARSYLRTWLAPFADFKIGDEEIKNFKLLIGETQTDEDADLLIGADFFISHRMLVSNSQNKLYFTYIGGPVFNMKMAPGEAPSAAAAGPGAEDAPKDADGFSRRAAAASSRRDYLAAVADLTQAIQLSPNESRYYLERALADMHLIGDPARPAPFPPIADLNQALTLKPDDIQALLARAGLHMVRHEPALARADLDAADAAAASQPGERLFIGEFYGREGFDKEAIAEIDQWIAAHPGDERMATALSDRCGARARLNQDIDKALADCNGALKLAPGDPRVLASRGLSWLRLGDYDRAIGDYDAALKLEANDAWALYGRGLAKLHKGLQADGQADLAAAAAIRPKIAEEAVKRGLTP